MTLPLTRPPAPTIAEAIGPPRLPEPDDVEAWLGSPLERRASGSHDVALEGALSMLSFLPDGPSEETKPLRFRTAQEIAATTSDEVEFAAAFLAFGAITELDGKPKAAGKTTFVLELVRAVLDGATFLARPTVKGPVVMLTEQPDASLKAALMRAGLTEREDFLLLSWADAASTAWPAVVAAVAARCRAIGARVLIVDTLPQFAGLRGDAENNSGDALEAIGPLQLLAAEGFAILVTRHDRKAGGEVGDSARGSGAFTGAVDIVLAMGRDAKHARPTMRHLACLSRFSETPPELVIELADDRYVVVGTSEEALAQARRERLLAALPDFDHPQRVESLAEGLDDTVQAVRALLNELLGEGLVARQGEGVRGKPYLWSRPTQDGRVLPFVPLRVTNERKETPPHPGPLVDEPVTVEKDWPRSAYAFGVEDE
jgi:AAA domain